MRLKAYAKLNLILNILGKREDGYHEIETLFHAIDLFDLVFIDSSKEDEILMYDFSKKEIHVPKESNLAFKALKLMKASFGKDESYNITIEKHIPIAAGLGGGSADGAAVIYALAKIWNLDLEKEEEKLYEIAASLGSDVPFCLAVQFGHFAAIGRGRGEKLEFVKPLELCFNLYKSKIRIKNKTTEVYKALTPEDYLVKYDIGVFIAEENFEKKKSLLGNHLQPALERLSEESKEYILCGAGPTYFELDLKGKYKTLS